MESWQHIERPLWAEGVLVAPQHFQLWDRYQQSTQYLRSSAGALHARGIVDLQIDEAALGNGVLRLRQCRVVMRDGRLIAFDEQVDGPLQAALADLPERGGKVYLGIPDNERAQDVPGYPQQSALAIESGWRARFAQIADEHDPQRCREVMFASPNLRLFVGHSPGAAWLSLPIVDLERIDEYGFRHSAGFIPSCCRMAVSPVVVNMIDGNLDRLQARIDILRRNQTGAERVDDFEPSQIARLLLLQILVPVAAELRNLRANLDAHPWHLFSLLIRLAAALAVFVGTDDGSQPDSFGSQLPVYNHDRLSEVLGEVDATLQSLLERALPQGVGRIKLISETSSIQVVEDLDAELLNNQSLYLAVRIGDARSMAWVDELPRQIKLAARRELEQTVASALPGIEVRHVQRPPNQLPVKSGYEYFRIEPVGEYWQRVCQWGSLAIYLPLALQTAQLEMVAVKDRY